MTFNRRAAAHGSKRDLYTEVTDKILSALDQGVAPWVQPWRSLGASGDLRNGSSGYAYNGVNVFLLSLLMFNGHHWLMQSLGSSFELAPIGRLSLGRNMSATFQAMFSEMFAAGIAFAAPVLIFLVIVSVLIGVLARAVPTLNVLELGFSIRVIVALCAMYMFAPLLEPAMARLRDSFVTWLDRGLAALGT